MDKDNMSEKTAEDKLREELDGEKTSEARPQSARSGEAAKPKARAVRPRTSGRKAESFSGLGQRVDSFMEDFARKIEESLNDVNTMHSEGDKTRKGAVGLKADRGSKPVQASPKSDRTGAVGPERVRVKRERVKAPEHREVEPLESILEILRPELEVDTQPQPEVQEVAVDAQSLPEVQEVAVDAQLLPEVLPAGEPQTHPDDLEPPVDALPQLEVFPAGDTQSLPEAVEPTVDAQPQPDDSEPTGDAQPQPEVPEPPVDAQPQLEVLPADDTQSLPEVLEPPVDAQPQLEVFSAGEPQPQLDDSEPIVDTQPQPEVPELTVDELPQLEVLPAGDTQSLPEVLPAGEPQQHPEVPESAVDATPLPEVSQPTVDTQPQSEVIEPPVDAQPQPEAVEHIVDAQPQPEVLPAGEPQPQPDDSESTVDTQPHPDDSESTVDEHPTLDAPEPPAESEYFPVDIVSDQDTENPDDEFPDIPVLEAEEISSPQDQHNVELPDIPVISSEDENFADITEIDDDINEFSEDPDDSAQGFSPFADVVLNVDSELPNLNADETPPEIDPEDESSPVTVTMPESTKTAEDKLLADIAEAMTGNPLSLESRDTSETYRLPDNFFSAPQDSQPQSAEEKLIANISQAMSESPIGIAQNNANQNLEDDLNPFEEMPVPEPTPTIDFDDDEQEEQDEQEDEDYEPFLPDFSAAQEQIDSDDKPKEDPVDDINIDDLPDPFAMQAQEPEDDKPSDTPDEEELSLLDDDFSLDESPAEIEAEPEPEAEPEAKVEAEPVSLDKAPEIEVEPETDSEPVNLDKAPEPQAQPVTAEERFAQELAGFVQQDSLNLSQPAPEPAPEPEAQTEPEAEQSLIDAPVATDSALDDDDFMASWGDEASAAMNFHDEEAEALQAQPEPQPEPEPAPAPVITPAPAPASQVVHVTEAGENSSRSTRIWRIVSQVLLAALLGLGITALVILHNLSGKLAGTIAPTLSVSPYGSYDYAIDRVDDSGIAASMKLRGIEGWKIVSSRRIQDEVSGNLGYEFIFMRATPLR